MSGTNDGWLDRLPRGSGVLLHAASLPGGRLGPAALRFVDWLAEAGQTWWQVLPLGPPDETGSPYNARSAFAGWPGLLADPGAEVDPAEEHAFLERNAAWAQGWAAFAGPGAIADQVRFDREWGALRAHAAARGVRILGDMPLYVAAGSADVRGAPGLFRSDLRAGVPPDYFAADGQLWGNPTYRWDRMAADGYAWWVARIARQLDLADAVRLDHFRGLVAWWGVPRGARTATAGTWRRGPGAGPVLAARAALGRDVPLVAEDLGLITPAVERLRDRLGLPGMRVLQFAFDGGAQNPHLPQNHPERSVAYTGTHDNDTTRGWWEQAEEWLRERVREVMRERGAWDDDPVWGMVRLTLGSPARCAIVPMQDLLGLGSGARMNTPGVRDGNWAWRVREEDLTDALAERLRGVTAWGGRLA